MKVRGGISAMALAALALLAVASTASACTSMIGMHPLSSPMGEPGREVRVSGTSPGTTPVEVRWDGLRGPLLALAPVDEETRQFSVDVRIPEAVPGVHYVVAVGGRTTGDVDAGWTRASFTIPGPVPPPAQPGQVAPGQPDPSLFPEGAAWQLPSSGASGPGSDMALGVGLLALGGVSLVVGFGVLGVRRRRAEVSAPSES